MLILANNPLHLLLLFLLFVQLFNVYLSFGHPFLNSNKQIL